MAWMGQAGAIVRPVLSAQLLAQTSTAGVCPAQLSGEISRIIDRGSVAQSSWSILVQTQGAAGSRRNLFNRNASTLLAPASNNKLFTTAAALAKLSAAYRIRTAVYGNSAQPSLTTLRIIGQGDPSLTTAQLQNLAQQVNQKGVRQVGTLIGDDTYFRGAATNPNWDAEDTLAGYGAAVNSLILNQNAIGLTLFPQRVGQPLRVQWDDPLDAEPWRIDNRTVTVSAQEAEFVDAVRDSRQWIVRVSGQLRAGSASELVAAAIPNPGNYLVQRFRTVLTRAGITVAQSTLVRQTPAPAGEAELGAIESPPLSQLLVETNQQSNNVFAEALLKTVGRVQTPANQDATTSGTAAVKAILTPLGVNPNRYSMVDGSGLADRNRASAEALVQTLQAMALSPDAQVFRNSLPVGGVSGTLQNRFRNTPAEGRVAAKTGTISGVVSLSGYLTPPNFTPLVFSIVANNGSVSASTLRSAVDGVVLVLTRLRSC
jgi:D-alanyl-D-alanine carboxypeptidase/D-alanyl-D-alanine-endopeptidase (penicillin-binding protein 4)